MRIGNPNRLRSTVGNTSLSAPVPDAPISVFLVRMSCQVAMPRPALKAHTLTSLAMLPIQLNFGASNCAVGGWESLVVYEVAREKVERGAVPRRGVEEV